MQRTLKLQTEQGDRIRIVLENWGSGLDEARRRWTMEGGSWLCVDSGQLAHTGTTGLKFFETGTPPFQFVPSPLAADHGADESAGAFASGQTMAEYLMILAMAGAVAWGTRNFVARDIGALTSNIGSSLSARPSVVSVQDQASGGLYVDLTQKSDNARETGLSESRHF